MLVKQCELGLGYPVAISEAPRAGGDHRPRPGGVPPYDPHAPGAAGSAHRRVGQGILQAQTLGVMRHGPLQKSSVELQVNWSLPIHQCRSEAISLTSSTRSPCNFQSGCAPAPEPAGSAVHVVYLSVDGVSIIAGRLQLQRFRG